jgi:GT2 family glycosyltransferase
MKIKESINTVGVVLLNYNSVNDVINCIDSIFKFDKDIDFSIVVVDNRSNDFERETLKNTFDGNNKVDLLLLDKNLGYAKGNNEGIKYLFSKYKTEYICVINPDVVLIEYQTIGRLINIYNQLNKPCLITPMMQINGENKKDLSSWSLPGLGIELRDNIVLIKKILNIIRSKKHIYINTFEKVDVVSGAFFFTSSEKFKLINFFDENTFLYFEEVILASKIKSLGLNNYLINNINYCHGYSRTISKFHDKLSKYHFLNESKLYYYSRYCKYSKLKLFILKFLFKIKYLEILIWQILQKK